MTAFIVTFTAGGTWIQDMLLQGGGQQQQQQGMDGFMPMPPASYGIRRRGEHCVVCLCCMR